MSFGRPSTEDRQAARAAQREANLRGLVSGAGRGRRGTYAGSTTAPAPKTEPYRDPVLLEMARGRPCLLCPPGGCTCSSGTVVACHSNWHALGGKAKNRKADDCYTVWGGREAHARLDQPAGHSGPSRAQRLAAFQAGHLHQVLAWREIATDPAEPPRYRRAARRALERLQATPIPEESTTP